MWKLGLRAKKSFVGIKPVSVVKHVEIWKFIFAKVVLEHTLGAVGMQYIPDIVGNLFRCHCAKTYRIGWHLTKLLQKQKGHQFSETQCTSLSNCTFSYISECATWDNVTQWSTLNDWFPVWPTLLRIARTRTRNYIHFNFLKLPIENSKHAVV